MKPFGVEGFTSAYLPVNDDDNAALFYANPYVYRRERYHFAMVTFADDDNMQNTCPARIRLIFNEWISYSRSSW